MSNQIKLVQNYFKILSAVAPNYAATTGIKLFSKVRLKGNELPRGRAIEVSK